ncbi:yeats family-domain-containing protein [Biscogniauxia sp. FL1348]|nr:yeats family-domain-containing protein [Biscogniauxia sp. FL1348]
MSLPQDNFAQALLGQSAGSGVDQQQLRRSARLKHMPERFNTAAEPTDTKNNKSGASTVANTGKSANSNTMQIERKVKLVTEQHTIPKESPMPDFPMKEWSVKIYLLDEDGNEHPANVFTKAVYNLHPSFENPQQTFTEPPFTCTNEGWGEFEMSIDLYTTEKAKHTVYHDLNFQSPKYETKQSVFIKNPSQALITLLRETGPVGNEDEAKAGKARKANDGKKRKAPFDYEKMADGMGKLGEDDLLHVIQMIHDNKSEDTFTKNDLEKGEFTVDLCTLPEPLLKMVWDFLVDQKMIA